MNRAPKARKNPYLRSSAFICGFQCFVLSVNLCGSVPLWFKAAYSGSPPANIADRMLSAGGAYLRGVASTREREEISDVGQAGAAEESRGLVRDTRQRSRPRHQILRDDPRHQPEGGDVRDA